METQIHRSGAMDAGRPAPLLRIHLLGRFEIVRADAPIPPQAWRRRRPADLLKLVALAPGRRLSRDAAIEALWPDKDPASGANNLHRALYDLRQILGGRWVDIERGTIWLRDDAWLDVDAFERAAEGPARDPAAAVSLYRGDLSPEDHESSWLSSRRVRLRSLFADVALPLARDAAAAGDAARAIPVLRRLVAVQPASEEGHRLLMRLLAEGGRRADALRQFDACEIAVRSAGLGPPGDEVRALRDAIQRGEIGPAQSRPGLDAGRRAARRLLGTVDPPPLRGRGPTLLLLESLLEQGHGALVLLGEAGVGKTRLAVEAARLAQVRGAAVLCGIAGGAAGTAPYALLADALADEARATGRANPLADALARGGGAGQERRREIFDAARAGIVAAADGRPVLLVLDAIHAADESSLNLVHFLLRDARALRLCVVATCREDAVHAGTPIQMALAHLDGERLARGLRIPRLGLAATRDQVADLLGAPPPEPTVAQLYRVTDGCPAHVEEVARAYRESGQTAVPPDVATAVRARVARLGPRAEALLQAASAAGARFELDLVLPLTGLHGHDAMVALEGCLEARLVDEIGAGHQFHDAVARDTVRAALPPERLAALHAALADAIEAASAGGAEEPASEAIAWHRREAGQPERAFRHLVAAGHRAAARAGLAEALASYSGALDLAERAGATPAELEELLDATARVQLALGELQAAARAFDRAARLEEGEFRPEPDVRARARRLAAVALAAGGHLRAAGVQLDAALRDSDEGRGDERAALRHLEAQLLWHQGRHAEALDAAEACAAEAERAGDADLLARGRDLAALARAAAGAPLAPPEDRTGPAERRRQDVAPEHPLDLHLVLWERDVLVDLTRAEVERAAALLGERARHRGAADALASATFAQGALAMAAGRLDDGDAILRAALELFRASGGALGEALALERLGTLLGLRGRLDEGMELLGDGVVVAERAGLRRHALVRLHAAEARNRLAAGAAHAAEEAIREASEVAARHGDCVTCDAALRPEVVRVALARGRPVTAEAEAAQLEEIARQRGGRGLRGFALASRARVLAASARTDDALGVLREAREAFAAAGLAYEAARCVRLGQRLRGAPASDPAEAALDALVVVDADA